MPRPIWEKGKSANPAGKPKGAKNKWNREAKDTLLEILSRAGGADEGEKLYRKQKWFRELIWRKYFDLIPKEVTIGGDIDKPVVFRWESGSGDSGCNGPI